MTEQTSSTEKWVLNADAFIEATQTGKELISHHTFMLPFKWTPKKRDGFISSDEFNEVVSKYLSGDDWESESFTLDRVVDYNEFHYFYDYVRDALYDYEQDNSLKNLGGKNNNQFIRHLSHTKAKGGKYFIQTPIPKSQRAVDHPHNDGKIDPEFRKTYELEIDSVLLHLYYTGVGVLSFHLHNRRTDQASPEDILYINQYGRRVFPPFYRVSHWKAGHQVGFDSVDFTGLGRPHGGEIAYEISLQLPGSKKRFVERWNEAPKSMLRDQETLTFRMAAFIEPFLGKLYAYEKNNEPHVKNQDRETESIINTSFLIPGDFKIQSVLDDRMFVICWYGNAKITKRLAAKEVTKSKGDLLWFARKVTVEGSEEDQVNAVYTDDWLYKFIFIDADQLTVQNPALRRELLDQATYQRWSGYGSYYGVTDYSFVLLTDELPSLREPWNNASFLVTHLQTIYFRLCELVLVQRASVQRFSDEVTHVSRIEVPQEGYPRFNELVDQLATDANELYKRYIRFVNRVYFREVTAQVQGIELYEKLQKQSRLPQMVDALKEEIHELHTYVQQETDRQKVKVEQERGKTLSLVAALFLAPTLLVAVYDLGFIGDCLKTVYEEFFLFTLAASVLAALISFLAFYEKTKIYRWGFGLVYLVLLSGPFLYCQLSYPLLTDEKNVTDTEVVEPGQSIEKGIKSKKNPPSIQSMDAAPDKGDSANFKKYQE